MSLRRREFIAGLGGAAAWPLAAGAQRRDLPVIGFLSSASVGAQATAVPAAFRKGLSQKGFVPGQNVIIETRQAEGHYEMLAALADDLIRIPVKVIVAAGGAVSARAAIEATKTIPVLFIAGFDPVKLGFVSSFNRPGGNATGVSIYTTELLAKRLQLLRELVPRISRVALLINGDNAGSEIEVEDMMMVAEAAGLGLNPVYASAAFGLEAAFSTAVAEQANALVVSADPFLTTQRKSIVTLAARHALPAVYPWREYVESGGLMSYGPILMDAYYQNGVYAGRILQGERAGDLPVQMPLKFELGINLRAAKALNLTVPRITILRADYLIEK